MKNSFIFLPILFAVFVISCTKSSLPSDGSLAINLKYTIDGQALTWNTIQYTNLAGNQYGIDRLQYYLSGFRFYKNKQLIAQADSVYFVDAQVDSTSKVVFPKLVSGTYDSISFYIGVDPKFDTTNKLTASLENIGMGWPDAMGGGYHFIKLEGHWMDSSSTLGYAIHLGMNGFQVLGGTGCALTVSPNTQAALTMTMNINEWFKNPGVYDFSSDGAYTMGNMTLMEKIKNNGADVFTAN